MDSSGQPRCLALACSSVGLARRMLRRSAGATEDAECSACHSRKRVDIWHSRRRATFPPGRCRTRSTAAHSWRSDREPLSSGEIRPTAPGDTSGSRISSAFKDHSWTREPSAAVTRASTTCRPPAPPERLTPTKSCSLNSPSGAGPALPCAARDGGATSRPTETPSQPSGPHRVTSAACACGQGSSQPRLTCAWHSSRSSGANASE